ncbi:MAG: response regulator [Saccharospirillaceae bacterium]|nr:response regulator [Pseudomonadales bacterium]NRB78452.1 response regulator [Saccharospirillaceae bacterium]
MIQSSKKCLVVDDLPFNTQVLKAQLNHLGYAVDCCFSGKKAITQAFEHDYDFIFMDISMPDMSGDEAATSILKYSSKEPAPIIFALSGHDEPQVLPQCFNLWLTKPVNKQQLSEIMHNSIIKS